MLRAIAAGILLFTVTSCTDWNPVSISPESYFRTHNPESVRVQLQDSSTFVLERPRVAQDTLTGIDAGVYRHVPLKQVVRLRAPEAAVARTALLATVSVAATAAVLIWAINGDHTQQ